MAKGGPAGSKILSQVGAISLTGQPTQPQGYPAKAALPRATPATGIRPFRAGPTGRTTGRLSTPASGKVPAIPTVKWH